jgi:hypothetical protein
MKLMITSKWDYRLRECMEGHYSQPKGFVGRSICYAILDNGYYYGHIVGGSATKYLPNRNEFFGINEKQLNNIINNIFFHIFKVNGQYPCRNFSQKVVKEFMKLITKDWEDKYGDKVIGFETLVEPPRTGEVYKRLGYTYLGMTKGFTCKRIAGKGTDSWGGKRVWDKINLRPKIVFAKMII